jgi:hypothetical protein
VQQSGLVKLSLRTAAATGILAFLGIAMGALPARAADANVYRLELAGNLVLLAKTPPVPRGSRLVFARYPDGAVMSVKRADVQRVIASPASSAAVTKLKPGQLVVLGPTGEGAAPAGAPAGGAPGARPGEGAPGTAMFNPARTYRPEWDSRQVPGQNLAYPASAGDYREGATLAYPPGGATQSSPGQPPTGVPTGQPPKSPS